jgi:hypothetical protein
MNNYRMGAYLILAMGLINLRYQSDESQVLVRSLVMIVPGIALLSVTFIPKATKILNRREIKALAIALGLLLVGYGITN